jgi:hypothetical protein
VNELAAAKRDSDVRCTGRDRFEEHQIPGFQVAAVDIPPDEVLLLYFAG